MIDFKFLLPSSHHKHDTFLSLLLYLFHPVTVSSVASVRVLVVRLGLLSTLILLRLWIRRPEPENEPRIDMITTGGQLCKEEKEYESN